MSDILAGLALGAGSAGTSGLLGLGASYLQQKYTRENMKRAYSLGQMEELRRASNQTKGLQMAGLNPALASEGKFSPASVSAPSVPNMPFPSVDLAQSVLMQAQAKKTEAEAENVQLQNENMQNENNTSQGLAIMQLEKMASELPDSAMEQKARLQALADMAKNRGALAALSSFSDMLDKRESYNSRAIQNRLQKAVVDYQLDEKHGEEGHSIIADLANMPSAEFAKLHATTMDLLRHAEWLSKNKELTEEEKNLKLQQINLTKEQINNLVAATKRINDTNLMKIADDVAAGKESPWKLAAAIAFLIFGNTHVGF